MGNFTEETFVFSGLASSILQPVARHEVKNILFFMTIRFVKNAVSISFLFYSTLGDSFKYP